MTIRVVVVDDHPFYREGVSVSLAAFDPEIEVVGEAGDGASALEACRTLTPDVVVMDLGMPDMGGLEAIRRLRPEYPGVAILVLTMFDDDSVFAALRAGAHGYLLKQATVDELSRAIHAVHRREGIFSPAVASRLQAHFAASPPLDTTILPMLTPREREILAAIALGRSTTAIARELGVAPKTVRNYIANLYTKLQVHDRDGATAVARDAGLA